MCGAKRDDMLAPAAPKFDNLTPVADVPLADAVAPQVQVDESVNFIEGGQYGQIDLSSSAKDRPISWLIDYGVGLCKERGAKVRVSVLMSVMSLLLTPPAAVAFTGRVLLPAAHQRPRDHRFLRKLRCNARDSHSPRPQARLRRHSRRLRTIFTTHRSGRQGFERACSVAGEPVLRQAAHYAKF